MVILNRHGFADWKKTGKCTQKSNQKLIVKIV